MTKKTVQDGPNTRILGVKLTALLKMEYPDRTLNVFCGHEQKKNRPEGGGHAIPVYMRVPGCDTKTPRTLSKIDLVVVDEEKVLLLCEVEEGINAEPKVIIGDICSALLADYIEYNEARYEIESAPILLALNTAEKGSKNDQVDFIKSRIVERFEVNSERIFIITYSNLTDLVESTLSTIRKVIGSNIVKNTGV
ncbi:MAG: hypothetical protein AB9819_07405 [Methanomassiliicoccales archaeon]